MKKKLYKYKFMVQRIIVLFFSLLAISQLLPTASNKAWAKEDNVKQITLKVDGMTCASCAPTIKTALKKMKGVLKTDVNVGSGEAYVDYYEGKVTAAQMIKIIENVGFKARLLPEGEKNHE